MPLKNQPGVTDLFARLSTGYLRYGPAPGIYTGVVSAAFASAAVLLACVPLYDALRSCGPKRLAAILVAPLGLFAMVHLGQVARACMGDASVSLGDASRHELYFWPKLLVVRAAGLPVPDRIISGDMVERGKPDPEAYRRGAELLGVPAADCVVVEDAPTGARAGVAAGCRVLGVLGTHSAEELREAGATWVVESLTKVRAEVKSERIGLEIEAV